MKSLSRVVVAVAALTMVAASGLAALSDQYVQFGKGPAIHIMTKDELAQWKNIKDDAAAQAFIDLFWARRDPSPSTPANEFRDDFDARVKYAAESFVRSRLKGSMSDRGKVLIIMGPPTRVQRTGTEPKSTIQTPGGPMGNTIPPEDSQAQRVQEGRPQQNWTYEQGKVAFPLPQPIVDLAFIDEFGSGDWKLERTTRTDYVGLFNSVNQRMITQPQLTEAPKFAPPAVRAQAPAVPMAPAAPTAPAAASFKTAEFQAAVDAFEAAKANPYDKPIFASWGEFVTPRGEYYVPVSLFVPRGSGFAADQEVTFFGVVEDESGKTVAVFEEPAKLMASRDDLVFDKSLTLPAGKHKGIFGLAQNGKPISMVTTEMNLAGALDKDAAGVSNLILSNNIYPLAEAQLPTDPFAFGGIKVVPKSDKVFSTTDELWYFFELRNPGIPSAAEATQAATTEPAKKVETVMEPRVQVKVDVSGQAVDGQKIAMSAPPMVAPAQELKGVPGHYGVGSSIVLEKFKPGDYTIKVKVIDTVNKKSYNLQDSFKVVGGAK